MNKKNSATKSYGNKLLTLKEVVGVPRKVPSTIGVVLDCTGTYRTNDSLDYVTKLRVIDNSFNPTLKRHKEGTDPTVYIFVYTETEKDAPRVKNIGDIILLKGFVFDKYSFKDSSIVRGNFNKSCSEWQVFEGKTTESMQQVLKSREFPSKVFREEEEQINKLRVWMRNFFNEHTLMELHWYKLHFNENQINRSFYELKDIDLLVRVAAKFRATVNGLTYHKLIFVDEKNAIYYAELQNSDMEFETDSVVKLRSVCVFIEDDKRKIMFYNYSAILFLYQFFKDYREIKETTKAISQFGSNLQDQFFESNRLEQYLKIQTSPGVFIFISPNELSSEAYSENYRLSHGILKSFDLSQIDFLGKSGKQQKGNLKIGSVVHQKHAHLTLTSLKRLHDVLNYEKKDAEFIKNWTSGFYKIRVQIADVESPKINNLVRVHSTTTKKNYHLNDVDPDQLPPSPKICFAHRFQLKDKSLGSQDTFWASVMTFDGQNESIYDLWKCVPKLDYVQDWLRLSAKHKKAIEDCFKNLANNSIEYDMVVIFKTDEEKNLYLKIVDTLFWFQEGSKGQI